MLSRVAERVIAVTQPSLLGSLAMGTPRAVIDRVKNDAFRRVVRYAAAHSPFYRDKFASFGIDPLKVNVPADLGNFYTTPADIVERAEDFL